MPYDMNTLIETYRMRLDIKNVRRIFQTGRPASSAEETEWVNKYLFTPKMQKLGMYKDGFTYQGEVGEGNCIIEIGEGSKTLFSSHTDTVHRTGGAQNVMIDLEESKLITDSGQCLGADDGTGIWLMLELIKARVPGLYIFHRAEEVGGQGSAFIANNHSELLQKYDRAIAFDRKDDWSIITHQGGSRCCSDIFGRDLAEKLDMTHTLDTGGSFTDTANYDGIIPECTNLSVGCHNCHSGRETQEIPYLLEFRDALIHTDWENLITERDPTIPDYTYSGSTGYSGTYVTSSRPSVVTTTQTPLQKKLTDEEWNKWDKKIDDKTKGVDDWDDVDEFNDIWDGSWDYLFDMSVQEMSEVEYSIYDAMVRGHKVTDVEFDETDDLDDMQFFDDDKSFPRTAKEFMDWTEPVGSQTPKEIEEEEEIIPDVESQELDWEMWFKE